MKAIIQHLTKLGLNPIPHKQPYPSVIFSLAPGLESELIPQVENKKLYGFSLVTTIDVEPHADLDIYSMTVAPAVTPLVLTHCNGQLSLRCHIQSSSTQALPLISEGIVLMRHSCAPLFNEALALSKNQKDLFQAIETAMTLLKSSGRNAH